MNRAEPLVTEAYPEISLVVAALQARDWLLRLCDDYRPLASLGIELIVVDGASNDGSDEVVRGREGVTWHSEPDSGVADAWNKALRLATGHWIVFAGADDRLGPPDSWCRTIKTLRAIPPGVSLVSFAVDVVSPAGKQLQRVFPRPGRNLDRLKSVNSVPHQGLFARREAFERVGMFDTAFRIASDYEWTLRATVAGEPFEVVDGASPLKMTFGGISTHDPLETALELRRAQAKLGVRGLRLAWWSALARARLRTVLVHILGRTATGRLADLGRRMRGLQPVWSIR